MKTVSFSVIFYYTAIAFLNELCNIINTIPTFKNQKIADSEN